ncbi:glycosyltransferase [Vibrio ostreicida]|uniref:glycosyltransferase n=1 Tax=Vibrio ostreicida TaxID=526588 RepID=UPI000970560B|nr:glycosyltransferase [Vibrio ostreicida]
MTAKILQLGKYYPPNWGGIETVTYNLNQVLDCDEFEVTTFCYGDSSTKSDDGLINRFNYYHIFRTPISFSMLFQIIRQADKFDYIILHVPNPWSILSLLMSGYNGKIVLYWHAESKGNRILEMLVNFFQDRIIFRADYILGATSKHCENMPNYERFRKKCFKYSYPVNKDLLDVSKCEEDKDFNFTSGVRLLNIGRLVDYKGQRYLIEAVKFLVKEGYDIYLTLVGNGPLYDELSQLISTYNLVDRIDIKMDITSDDLKEELVRSHIFCFPSVSEQEMYGMAQIEAYAYGLPVITTDIPRSGVQEVASSSFGALIVKPRNVCELVSSVKRIISEEGLALELSRNGKNYVRGFSYSQKRSEFRELLSI